MKTMTKETDVNLESMVKATGVKDVALMNN